MSQPYHIAIIGATGLVGRTLLDVMQEEVERLPAHELHLFASERSQGEHLSYGAHSVRVQALSNIDFKRFHLVFFCVEADLARQYVPLAIAAGCWVIDNSSAFRQDDAVPLIVPEVNGDLLQQTSSRLIANPNCSTIQLVVVLAALQKYCALEDVQVATYQSVSGTGQKAIESLTEQMLALMNFQEEPENTVYDKPIALNVLARCGDVDEQGWTAEENKIRTESRRILGLPKLSIRATCVRVPVVFGHSEAVHLRLAQPLSADYARELLSAQPGVTVIDQRAPGGYPCPFVDASQSNQIFVGRLRNDPEDPQQLALWISADNMRKGAAWNALQIAQSLWHLKRL